MLRSTAMLCCRVLPASSTAGVVSRGRPQRNVPNAIAKPVTLVHVNCCVIHVRAEHYTSQDLARLDALPARKEQEL
jgi:hypothetical protein